MEKETKRTIKHWLIVGGLFGGVIIAEIVNIRVIERYYDKLDRASFFGGYHGAISAVFTGLAAAFTLYLIFLQREEIQQNEMNRRADEEAQRRDRFYQKFFKLIDLWRNATNSLEFKSYGDTHSGIACFNEIEKKIKRNYLFEKRIQSPSGEILPGGKTYDWAELMSRIESDDESKNIRINLNHEMLRRKLTEWIHGELDFTLDYLSLVTLLFNQIATHAVKIDDLALRDEEQREFAEIISAVISHDELVYLMYAGASGGYPEIKHWLEKFGMLTKLNNWHWRNATTGYALSSYPGRSST